MRTPERRARERPRTRVWTTPSSSRWTSSLQKKMDQKMDIRIWYCSCAIFFTLYMETLSWDVYIYSFLGLRGPLGTPLSVRPFVRPPVGKKNLDQLYSSVNHHRTTANLSDIVWCMSGGVWWCLEHVWWCLMHVWWCLVHSCKKCFCLRDPVF